jgi:predicted NBD/HSP70 family sugar kinase
MSDECRGIDLGGANIEAAVVDADNKVLAQSRHPPPTDGGPAKVADEKVKLGSAVPVPVAGVFRLGADEPYSSP